MTDVTHKPQGFDQILIESQGRGDGPRDLHHFDGVRQPVAEMVGVPAREDLGLVLKPAESAGMDDPVPVSLKIVAIWMTRLRIAPSPAVFRPKRVRRQHGLSVTQEALSSQHSAF